MLEHFENLNSDIENLKNILFVEGEKNYKIRDFLKEMILKNLTDREKLKIHEKIATFYAEQIPLKPNERVISLSRTTLYSEKF